MSNSDNMPANEAGASGTWAARYVAERSSFVHIDDPARWDARAASFGSKLGPSDYILNFIDKLDLMPGESVLDMGCGNGNVALLLAQDGHDVLACDFSQGMIAELNRRAEKKGINNVTSKIMSWQDDWEAFGVLPKSVDVAFASRSMITADLRDSIRKLTATARRKACATLGTGYAPHVSAGILKDLGINTRAHIHDYRFGINILLEEGFHPCLSYCINDRHHAFATPDDGLAYVSAMIDAAAAYTPEAEIARARTLAPAWVESHTSANPQAGTVNGHGEEEGPYCIDIPGDVIWAFLSWDVREY